MSNFVAELAEWVHGHLEGDLTAASNILGVRVSAVENWLRGEALPHWQVQDAVLAKFKAHP